MENYEQLKEKLKHKQYTWLITGVAGFIGSNLLETLLSCNQKVIGLDNFETGYKENLDAAIYDAERLLSKDLKHNFHFIEGDIQNLDDCMKACNCVDYVLHQAALGSVPRSINDPIKTNQTNISGFLNMLVASRDSNVKKFVYAASSSTYGDHPDLPKVEEIIGNPLSPYAVTKYVNELYANIFSEIYNLQSIGLRYFNIFGKRQDPNGAYAAVIPQWISSTLAGEEIYINGNGSTSRDFCYIENAVQANILAAMSSEPMANNTVYNVALNNRTSLNELYQYIKKYILELIPNMDIKDPKFRDFRVGDVLHSQADISKAMNFLNYNPSHQIKQGLKETIYWFVNKQQKV